MKKEELAWVFGGLEEGSGMADGEKKKKKKKRKRTKEEDGEQEIESLRLDFHVDLLVHLSFANTQKSSLSNSICYSEIKSKRLELLVS